MSLIKFYTKPGCLGGLKQKDLLSRSGHTVEEYSLLAVPWTPEMLRPYFGQLSISEWYNLSAPAVKAGKIIPGALPERETLELLCRQPILIRRPLMEINGRKLTGFDVRKLAELIPLSDIPEENLDGCQMMQSPLTCDDPKD